MIDVKIGLLLGMPLYFIVMFLVPAMRALAAGSFWRRHFIRTRKLDSKATEIQVRGPSLAAPCAFAEHSVFVGRVACYD